MQRHLWTFDLCSKGFRLDWGTLCWKETERCWRYVVLRVLPKRRFLFPREDAFLNSEISNFAVESSFSSQFFSYLRDSGPGFCKIVPREIWSISSKTFLRDNFFSFQVLSFSGNLDKNVLFIIFEKLVNSSINKWISNSQIFQSLFSDKILWYKLYSDKIFWHTYSDNIFGIENAKVKNYRLRLRVVLSCCKSELAERI